MLEATYRHIRAAEKRLRDDPKEKEVIAAFKAKADEFDAKLKDILIYL